MSQFSCSGLTAVRLSVERNTNLAVIVAYYSYMPYDATLTTIAQRAARVGRLCRLNKTPLVIGLDANAIIRVLPIYKDSK